MYLRMIQGATHLLFPKSVIIPFARQSVCVCVCLTILSMNLVFDCMGCIPTLWLLNASYSSSGVFTEGKVMYLNAGGKTSHI